VIRASILTPASQHTFYPVTITVIATTVINCTGTPSRQAVGDTAYTTGCFGNSGITVASSISEVAWKSSGLRGADTDDGF
jgi:hypothetical protein